jgi:hypothetical protein
MKTRGMRRESVMQRVNKLFTEVEITHRKNAKRKNTNGNNEIPAKGIQIHWPPQEKMGGNVRPEHA